jgi:hypothetical protein
MAWRSQWLCDVALNMQLNMKQEYEDMKQLTIGSQLRNRTDRLDSVLGFGLADNPIG